jgi:Regulator of Chromosome Condensation (RCC1) repeat protein
MVSAGAQHTCGVTADRHPAVYCWGSNFHGQGANWRPRIATDAPFIAAVDAGARHTCVVREVDNAITCFGNNLDDQLGRDVFGRYTQVSAGGAHTCAVRPDGDIMCWGRNAAGQLGNGSWYREARPVHVVGPVALNP